MKGGYFIVLLFIYSCSSLKYEAIKTPQEIQQERRGAVENYLKSEFQKKNISYSSVDFDKTTVVKPASYYVLDSLYEIKYRLERKNKVDKVVEQKILNQQSLVNRDTTPIYYVENHIFSLVEDEKFKAVHAKVIVSKDLQVQTMEIVRTAHIPKQLITYFADYCLGKSFFYSVSYLDESEAAFYEFYTEKLNMLEGDDADQFMITMLQVMKFASDSKDLDKTNLIRLMTLYYITGNAFMSSEMKFSTIEEFFNQTDQLLFYQLYFTYPERDEKNKVILKEVEVRLDPYLSLIGIAPVVKNK